MKARFQKEDIQAGLTGIILLSHGPLATAMAESAFMIIGQQDNLAAFGLEPSDTLEEYISSVMQAYDAFGGDAVVLVDMFGGTPCNQLVAAALRNALPILALSGMSLPMVMEACALRSEYSGEALLKQIMDMTEAGQINITEKLAKH